ncbi:MAG: tRNA pseudouridine(55) synthase TruB [Bacteroidales bacterium]|nr:tRNA pseudouridine(55) synthase TruB [Bacteroidales bacterium]
MNFTEGEVLLFDKPYGWTSFQLVNKIRWLLCRKLNIKKLKVGHAGTLDPLATGLMVICTGKATKKIPELTGFDKEYIAEMKIGETTPSFDKETLVDKVYPTEHIDKSTIEGALMKFRGEIEQIPPDFSAKYVDGKRAYHFARKGIEIELKPSKITINEIELISYENLHAVIRINSSKGTYIRSVARDLGRELQSGAYLTALQRTQIGSYTLEGALTIQKFENILETL